MHARETSKQTMNYFIACFIVVSKITTMHQTLHTYGEINFAELINVSIEILPMM